MEVTMPNLNMDIQQTMSRLWNNWKIIRASNEDLGNFYNSLLETWMKSDQIVQKINSNSSRDIEPDEDLMWEPK